MNRPVQQEQKDYHAAASPLQVELVAHLPFSVSSVAIGLTFAGLICYLAPAAATASGDHHGGGVYTLFHLFHPMHMFFSAAATTAMFWRYDRSPYKAVIIGLIGAVGVCGVSDIVFPQLSLAIMGKSTPWHICIVQNPSLVLPFAAMGVIVGLSSAGGVSRSTLFSHSLHVLASTAASIFYLVAGMKPLEWVDDLGHTFIFVIVAVMVPCCLSDIVFPLLMSKNARDKARLAHAHHCCESSDHL